MSNKGCVNVQPDERSSGCVETIRRLGNSSCINRSAKLVFNTLLVITFVLMIHNTFRNSPVAYRSVLRSQSQFMDRVSTVSNEDSSHSYATETDFRFLERIFEMNETISKKRQESGSSQKSEDSEMRDVNKKYVIARLISNDLPPLHSWHQTYDNTKFIIENEVLPKSFRRLWVITNVIEQSKERELMSLLGAHNEWFYTISIPEDATVKEVENQAFSVNYARNSALMKGFSQGASWVFLFDGCTFLSRETISTLEKFLASEDEAKSVFHFTPMFRLNFNEKFGGEVTYRGLFPFISGLEETHLGVSSRYLSMKISFDYENNGNFLFDESRSYGDMDKVDLLWHLMKHHTNETHCTQASPPVGVWVNKKSASPEADMKLIERCGWSLRLLYFPDGKYDQTISNPQRWRIRTTSQKVFHDKVERLYGHGMEDSREDKVSYSKASPGRRRPSSARRKTIRDFSS